MRLSRTTRSAVFVLLLAAGCKPTCEQVCTKLVECENPGTERMSGPECEEQCKEQQELYMRWTDTELRDAFDDQLSCLDDSSCEDIAGGVCYDEDLWSF